MGLTREQERNLELYKIYRDHPPSVWQLFRANLWRYLLLAFLVLVLYLLAPAAGIEALPLLVTGLFLGVLGRDLGTFLRFIRLWPVTTTVIDWPRLEALLAAAAEKQ